MTGKYKYIVFCDLPPKAKHKGKKADKNSLKMRMSWLRNTE